MSTSHAHRFTTTLALSVLVQLGGALVCAAVSFALTLILARKLGSAQFGQYVSILSLATIGLILQEGGWPTLLYRERAQSQAVQAMDRKAFAWGHVIVVTLGLIPFGLFRPDPGTWASAAICMGFVAVMNGVSSVMRGTGLFAHEALWQIAGRMVSALFIGGLLIWDRQQELTLIFVAWAVGLAVVMVLGGRRWLTRPRWPWTDGFCNMKGNYRQLRPFVLMAATGAWLIKGDMVLLGLGLGFAPSAQDMSMYAACTRLTEAGLLIFAPFANVLFRRLNQLHANKEQAAIKKLGWRSLALALSLGSAAVGLSLWLGNSLMPLLFGASFTAASSLLPWVSCMLPLAMANLVLSQWLTALGRERFLSRVMLLSATLLTFLLPWMTSHWGLQGTALSVVVAQALLLLLSLSHVTR